MSGTLLGPDQVRKINSAFPALVSHIESLLSADHSGVGLMRVHSMVESFDSDHMATLFRELSFISPLEKKALVRAAIYELVARKPALFVSPEVAKSNVNVNVEGASIKRVENAPATFTPPQFNLNINKTEAFHPRPADTPPPAPVVTSTHTPIVAEKLKAGDAEQKAQQSVLDAAVAKLRESSAPKVIEIPVVPEDAALPEPTYDGQSQE